MTAGSLILRYAAFAVLAILINLGMQRLCLTYLGDRSLALPVAIFLGTLAGLLVKYVLDKRWIFHDTSSGASVHTKKFGLYTLMGIATTLIFWGFEYSFWVVWQADHMREVGAVIGLTIGYVVKYWLDRRFVFGAPARFVEPVA